MTGLWEGNTIGKVGVSRALKPELTGAPVRFAMGVKKDKRNTLRPISGLGRQRRMSIKTPKLMTLVPGYENLFEMSIQALHPVGGDGSFAFMELKEWRNRLVFQGPRASEAVDYEMPYYWDNFSGRQWARALRRQCALQASLQPAAFLCNQHDPGGLGADLGCSSLDWRR